MEFDEYYLKAFFDLLEQPKIKNFVENDKCKIITDKYLLATVFIFFRRADFPKSHYNRRNFHLALYLSHELNEDVEDFKDEIIENYLGPNRQFIRTYHENFLKDRVALLERMQFNGHVSKSLCDHLMMKQPHWAWTRTRDIKHSGVFYKHVKCKQCYLKYVQFYIDINRNT